MASAHKVSPPSMLLSTQQLMLLQQQVLLLILLFCLAFMMPFISSSSNSNGHVVAGCMKAERDALLAFKAEIIYHKDHDISSWGDLTDDCCQWPRVRCDNKSGHVIQLDLKHWQPAADDDYYNTYYDYYTSNYYYFAHLRDMCNDERGLSGNISPSLAGLKHLRYLDLSCNLFFNVTIPKFLGSLANLVHLDLSNSHFTGVIPHELGNLTRLSYLGLAMDLYFQTLQTVQVDDAEWLSGLSSLRYLFMDGVDLSGVTNIMQSLNKLQHLKEVSLAGCGVKSIPKSLPYLNFTSLIFMEMGDNMFDNTSIPEWLFRIPNIRLLHMNNCGWTGTIPSSVGNATSLQYLGLPYNSGISGDVPRGFGDLCNLQRLYLDETFVGQSLEDFRDAFSGCIRRSLIAFSFRSSSLKGPLPDWLGEFRNLTYLELTNNFFQSSIPESLGRLSRLKYLDLSNNSFSGAIPSDLGNFGELRSYLTILSFSSNNLTGSIPSSLCNFTKLSLLDLSNNHLEGVIPNCWNNLTNLQYLILANNSLKGKAPNSLISSSQSLQVLHFSSNRLHGEFPSFLKNCTSLITLALDHNSLSGNIPAWVGETMTSLMIITLKQNNFSGNLPLLSNLMSLHFLDFSHNSFTGSIPQSYGNLKGMVNNSMNGGAKFTGNVFVVLIVKITVATKGVELQYGIILSSLKFIDLSMNNLSGQIPKEIVNLVGLQNLDLSFNYLTGEIPGDIGAMQSLESLDLSRNELIGSIPTSLSTLHFLESLNLSHNNLSGRIPYASQLTTFNDPSIYDGNLNLCGAPLDKNCTSTNEPTTDSQVDDQEDDDDNNPLWFFIGLMPGFVVGFWTVCGVLLFKKKWRHAYFKFVDYKYDMIYVKVVVTTSKLKRALMG